MRTFKNLLFLCILAVLAACSEDAIAPQAEIIPSTGEESVDLISMVVPDIEIADATTRSKLIDNGTELKFVWQENDAIGIVPMSGNPLRFPIHAENAQKNTAVFDGGQWALRTNAKYAAFYPIKVNNQATDVKHIAIDYTGQTQSNWMKYDFLATGAVQPKDGAVKFTMQRLSAILKIQVNVSNGDHLRYLTLVAPDLVFGVSGTLDLSGNSPVYTPKEMTKFINTDIGVERVFTSDETVSIYMMIPPADLSGKELKLRLTSDEGYAYEKTLTGKNFEAGKAYIIEAGHADHAMITNSKLIEAAGLSSLAGSEGLDAWEHRNRIRQVTTIYVSVVKDSTVCDEIGFFRNLQELDCSYNNITCLDLSNNQALTTLKCSYNKLTDLDVSTCPALTTLECTYNSELTSLNISNNPALTNLLCNYCNLVTLDASTCPALTKLNCDCNNQLVSLNVSNCPALTYLACRASQITSLDVSKCVLLKELYCYSCSLTSLDVSNNPVLAYLMCNQNELTSLDISSCQGLKSLSCYNNQLTSLDVSNCLDLEQLDCYENQLTSLDVTNNKNLKKINCNYNPLTTFSINTGVGGLNKLEELSLNGCSNLETLSCGNRDNKGQLKLLGLFNCTKLSELNCMGNLLTQLLDISTCTNLTSLYCCTNMISSLNITKNKKLPLDNLVCGRQWANTDKTESLTLNLFYTSNNTGSLPEMLNYNTGVTLHLQ